MPGGIAHLALGDREVGCHRSPVLGNRLQSTPLQFGASCGNLDKLVRHIETMRDLAYAFDNVPEVRRPVCRVGREIEAGDEADAVIGCITRKDGANWKLENQASSTRMMSRWNPFTPAEISASKTSSETKSF